MLLVLALLSATPIAAPSAVPTAPVQTRMARKTTRKARPVRVTKVRLPRRTALSGLSPQRCSADPACAPRADTRYRIADAGEPLIDAKAEAARPNWKTCGVTGMPVCPSRGRTLVKASLGD